MIDSENRVTAADVAVGDTGPELIVEALEREDFVRYAGASGDFNPIHYDEPFAKAAGNPSVFGQGMLTAAYAANVASEWFGVETIERFRVRFRDRVWPGDSITATGEIVEVESTADGATVEADIVVSNQDGDAVVTGTVTAKLPEEGNG